MSHMSVPATIDLPCGYRRVAWPGRMGAVAAVVGAPADPFGSALLLPGLTGSKEDYFAILGGLHDRGWAVAAVDLPGMFESDGSDDPGEYSLADLVGDVSAMLPLVPGRRPVHLVGHSAGGLIARHVAVARPFDLASLTLYDSGSGPLCDEAAATTALLCSLLETTSPAQIHRLKSRMDADAGRPPPPQPIAEFLAQRWRGTSAGHLLGMARIALAAADLVPELATLSATGQVPILALYGEHDTGTWPLPGFTELARVANRTVVVPDAEHSPAVENPAAVVAALDSFWREQL